MNTTTAEAVLEPVKFDPFVGDALERVIPTSEAQREVWLADKLSREASLAFNESVSLRLAGRLDRKALEGALSGLLARHDALRATIGPDGTELLVNATASIKPEWKDLESLPEAQRATALAEAASKAVDRPFDLEHGPLFRAELYRLNDLEHVLLMTAHHIICDGWSWGVMIESIGALYSEQTGAAPGPDPAPSYAEYVAWESAQVGTAEMAEHEKYWLGRFGGSSLPVLDLMPDRPRAPVRSFAAHRIDYMLDRTLVADLRKLGAKAGASAFAAMFSGFAATLHRLTGQDDLVIGVPTAGQSASGMTGLIGHCVNLLPVRMSINANQSFDAFLRQSASLLLDAFDHQALTYGSMLKKLPVNRDPSRMPLVSVMFNVDQALESSSGSFPDLKIQFANNARHFENFELFVNATQRDGGLCLECQYNTDLFDAQTVRRWMMAYEALLRAAASDPLAAINRLAWIAPKEHEALVSLQPPPTIVAADELMHSAIERQCAISPQRVALRYAGEQLTYLDLDQQSNRMARVLRERGIQRGERIGLCLPRGINMVVGLLAVLKAGGTYVPLDPGFPQARLAYYAEDANLALLLTESGISTAPLAWRSDAAQRVWCLDRDTNWLRASPAALVPSDQDAHPSSTAYIIYTSGSTGQPKGVCLPHRAAANFLASMAIEPGIASDDKLAAVTTLSFDIAVLELLLPLCVGAQVIVVPRDTAMDGNLLRELMQSSGATVMQATPGMWRMLLDTPWSGGPGFKALVGGESLPSDLAHDLLNRCSEVWNMYGPTETTVWSTLWRVDRAAIARRGVSIGRPIANTSVWILSADLQPCPIGVPGEICIGGEGVAQGYLNRPELTADRFVADPFTTSPGARVYRTGDRGRWRNDGLLEHLGRLDFQVKVRGYRIELGEIEAGCNELEGVSQSVVLAREDNPGDVRLVAYLTVAGGLTVDEVVLRAHLRNRLPEYMLPQHVVVLDCIPLLPNGKVDRKALPPPSAGATMIAERVAPRTDLERSVAAVMQATLKLTDIGIHDNFFSLGGHSLLAARLIGRLNREQDVQLSLRTLFEAPTVEKLALAVEQQRAEGAGPKRQPIVHLPQRKFAPLSLMQERMRFIDELYPGGVSNNTPSAHHLRGPMNLQAFDAAFAEMVRRQSSLRTRIVTLDDGFVQVVDDEVKFTLLPLEDLSAMPEDERQRELVARMDVLMSESFTLDKGPLFQARLYKLAVDEHVLFFMTHHIIWDGFSFDLLYEEMSAHYTARLLGRATALPPPLLTYGDFAAWHNQWLSSDELAKQLQYWKDQYATGPAPREPHLDRIRPPGSIGRGGAVSLRLELAFVERLRDLAKKTGTTASIITMSVFSALMCQWFGDSRPTIGLPVRGRPAPELENVTGCFINMLPLRMMVDTSLTGVEWIRNARDTMTHGFANQDVPFELVAREIEVGRRGGSARMNYVRYTFQDVRQRPVHWGPLVHSRFPVEPKGVTEDIDLWLVDTPTGISGGLQYDADAYLPETAEALRDQFVAMLVRLVQDPSARLSRLMAPNSTERAKVYEWSRPTQCAPLDLLGVIGGRISSQPSAVAAEVGGARLTYGELGRRIDAVSRALRPFEPLATVALCVEDPLFELTAAIAVWSLGGQCLALDASAPESALRATLAAAAPALILGDPGSKALSGTIRWLDAGTLLAAQHPTAKAGGASRAALPQRGLDHRSVGEVIQRMLVEFGLDPGCTVVTVGRAAHGLPLLDGILALAAGGRWCPTESADAKVVLDRIGTSAVSVLRATPDIWQRLLAVRGDRGLNLIAIQDVRELPVPMVAGLHKAGCRIFSALHPDLIGLPVAGGWIRDEREPGVFGRPLVGVPESPALLVADLQGQPVAPGMTGDMVVRMPDESLHTVGIRCRWRCDGILQYLGEFEKGADASALAQPTVSVGDADSGSGLSATEIELIEVWSSLLSVDGISPEDNFFELGGTSLMAMQAVAMLEQRLARRVPARRYVFDSLGQLAAAYDDAASASPLPARAAVAAEVISDARAPKGLLNRLAGLLGRS